MQFEPQSEEQCKPKLLNGEVNFAVAEAEDRHDKGYLHLTLQCWDDNGDQVFCHVYLTPKFMRLVRHFAFATGLGDHYLSGRLDAETCQGAEGRCTVSIRKQPGYNDKNNVDDFVVPEDVKNSPAYAEGRAAQQQAQRPTNLGAPSGVGLNGANRQNLPQPVASRPRPGAPAPTSPAPHQSRPPTNPQQVALGVAKTKAYEAYFAYAKGADANASDADVKAWWLDTITKYFGSREAASAVTDPKLWHDFVTNQFNPPGGVPVVQAQAAAPVKEDEIPF